MDNVTIKYFGEIIASASAWYTYECARLSEQPQNIDGDKRGRDDREVEKFIENASKGAEEKDMVKYADGSFRVRNKKTGLLEYRFMNLDNVIQSVYGYSQQECWAKRTTRMRKAAKEDKRLSLESWTKTWFDTYKKPYNGEQSLKSISLYLSVINEFFGKIKLEDVDSVACQRLINKYADRPNTQKKLYQVLHALFEKAVIRGFVRLSPAADIMLMPHVAEHYRALTYEEQNIVYYASEEKYRQLFFFCCCTGIRLGRVLSLTRENVKDGYIEVVKKQKRGLNQVYRVPYLPELLEGLPEKGRLFPLDASRTRKHFKDIYDEHGIKGATLHTFRHTFVSVLYDIGVDPKRIQSFAGHANIDITMNIYTHLLNNGTSPIKEYLQRLFTRKN